MTDEELVAQRLAFIETCLRELRETRSMGPSTHEANERRIESTIQSCPLL
jgi:hypothetical protein